MSKRIAIDTNVVLYALNDAAPAKRKTALEINCQLVAINKYTVELAHTLIVRYDFQYFDSIIVAGALQADCTVLYSEDMHHDLLVEKQLRIINPFL